MKNAIVLNTLVAGNRWQEKIHGIDPVGELVNKLKSLVKAGDIFVVALKDGVTPLPSSLESLNKILLNDLKAKSVFRQIYSSLKSYDNVIYSFIDTPLLDTGITKEMLSLHTGEFAEYTYGEGFPLGITPEIIKVDLLPKIASLLEKDNADTGRESIFSGLSKEINSFDIETYFSEEDLKLMRIELTTSSKRNSMLVGHVVKKLGIACKYEQFCKLIAENPAVLRTVPSYVEIEITNRQSGNCVYSPLTKLTRKTGSMVLSDFKNVIDKLKNFTERCHVALSLWGEPLLHGDINKIIEYSVKDKSTDLILETDGICFDPSFSEFAADLNAENLHIIFEVDAVEPGTYEKIRGGDLNKVERNIRYLLSKGVPNIYVQMVRIEENENEMLKFFDMWEKEGAKPIIQKYNSYAGILPDLIKYDLSPLERMPCWHVQRDMVVLHDGSVPRCKQDINCLFPLGNLLQEDISDVWGRGEHLYLEHCNKNYDELCTKCDEYYTFNF
jgi:spiro-SPASM protein